MNTRQIIEIQSSLFLEVKKALSPTDSIGLVLSDVLSISTDAAYRRLRNETALSIEEVALVCSHFNISFDALIQNRESKISFDFLDVQHAGFSLESYLSGILTRMKQLLANNHTRLYLVVNNVHFFQALNFPEIIHFRLFFWAKSHLFLQEYKHKKMDIHTYSKEAYNLGRETLHVYNLLDTVELVDRELMRGYLRQILFAMDAGWFKEDEQALTLVDKVLLWLEHYRLQAEQGKKFMVGNISPAGGSTLSLHLNDTVNTDSTFYYVSSEETGVYLTHNIMNYLHTKDEHYVRATKNAIDRQLSNSNVISLVNSKDRHKYFEEIKGQVLWTKAEIIKKMNRA